MFPYEKGEGKEPLPWSSGCEKANRIISDARRKGRGIRTVGVALIQGEKEKEKNRSILSCSECGKGAVCHAKFTLRKEKGFRSGEGSCGNHHPE